VLLGLLIPLANIPMAIVLLVAIVTVHLPNGFSSTALVALVIGGSGPLALDRMLLRKSGVAD